jgi:quercetin dioxygenase-like cupin family protein
MAVAAVQPVRVMRWHGGQHPTLENITRLMKDEGLRPYMWVNTPNFRYPVRSHGYSKTLYCVQGSLEITFPQTKQRVTLRAGDRVDVPRGVRYSAIIGPGGAQCVEGSEL